MRWVAIKYNGFDTILVVENQLLKHLMLCNKILFNSSLIIPNII
jgi:hypothetical protein